MKKFAARFCALTIAALLFIPSGQAVAAGKIVFQIGHVDVPQDDNHNQYFAKKFAEILADLSKGQVEIQIMPNSQLGAERDMMEGMQLGTVDMAIITNLAIGSFMPEYMVYDLPYLFKDDVTAFKVLDSDLAKRIDDKLFKTKGIKVLAKGQGGFRQTINNVRPLREVADMKGVKIRVPENPLFIATFKAIGANPTPMAWNETFTGMQQKTIDGLEYPSSVVYTTRFYEVAKYMSATRHFFSPVVMMISSSAWNSLDAATQALFEQAAQSAAADQRAFISKNELRLFDELPAKG